MSASKAEAVDLDRSDPLSSFRNEFVFPTKRDIGQNRPSAPDSQQESDEPCLYLCGNSLGLQPKRTADRVNEHLKIWATKGVTGHFVKIDDSSFDTFLNMDAQAAKMMAPVVGASEQEVAVAETLTANLHLMMAAFYKPTDGRHKVIIEQKAFPSDHYAVESQITHHGFDAKQSMICIQPSDTDKSTLDTSHILSVIDQHAEDTALILLPGIQYYTGQFFDIPKITEYAHSRGIIVGWDLAHAVGNVELSLHDWNVDFAVWCSYKYINAGPGAVAGMFVHTGWWGGDKSVRFQMGAQFTPIPGAQGFQVGNPSALAISSLIASLEVFHMTSMASLRKKSVQLTGYLERLLLDSTFTEKLSKPLPYSIITPASSKERGAQLSIRVNPSSLGKILERLEEECVIVDERKPDVVRVAPTPLYNTFEDVWNFVRIFTEACRSIEDVSKT